ncbi:hypothetical protein BU26DRAFT_519895, partial [Trematosphaeria pertusa]
MKSAWPDADQANTDVLEAFPGIIATAMAYISISASSILWALHQSNLQPRVCSTSSPKCHAFLYYSQCPSRTRARQLINTFSREPGVLCGGTGGRIFVPLCGSRWMVEKVSPLPCGCAPYFPNAGPGWALEDLV